MPVWSTGNDEEINTTVRRVKGINNIAGHIVLHI